ncbi:MAG: GTP cyclohydrolase II [Planctomycetales bacterium]|nr:GTP cyclohydrolase II [Planctomycetales bacterium]
MEEQLPVAQKVVRVCAAQLPTIHGQFEMTIYHDGTGQEHVCLSMGDLKGDPLLIRVHSECLSGDVFGSVRCDCRDQLTRALTSISAAGRGILIYLRQEGRGIGLTNKIQAYALQDEGLDTVDANLHLGLPVDDRSYAIAAEILVDQGVSKVRLLTNNPHKVCELRQGGIEVERVPHEATPRDENRVYLRTKADRLGHLLHVTACPATLTESAPTATGGNKAQ